MLLLSLLLAVLSFLLGLVTQAWRVVERASIEFVVTRDGRMGANVIVHLGPVEIAHQTRMPREKSIEFAQSVMEKVEGEGGEEGGRGSS